MERVLITGGTGFIGSHLAETLVKKGLSVRCLIRETSDLRWINDLDVQQVIGDVIDLHSLKEAVSNIDTVFHAAGQTKALTESSYYETNVTGTLNLLKAVVQWNPHIKRFIYISSLAASGPSRTGEPLKETDLPQPLTPYGISKLTAEDAIKAFSTKIPVSIVRPPIVYGPRDETGFDFFRVILKRIKPVPGRKNWYASMVYIDDFIRGLILVAQSESAVGETYFLVSETFVAWRDVIDEVAHALHKYTLTIHFPIWFLTFLAWVGKGVSRLTKKPFFIHPSIIRELKHHYWICDGSKAREELGFEPEVSLKEGIQKTIAWCRHVGWIR
jgi:nucleoside-diphosphate-sugar epimerase